MNYEIAMLPGDGVGPEIMAAAKTVLARTASAFGFEATAREGPIGGAAVDASGSPLPADVAAMARAADAVLLGAVGGPRWDGETPERRPERGLLALRAELGLFANLRPVAAPPVPVETSPFKPERVAGVDILFVRELTGGIYFGEKTEGDEAASDLCTYSAPEIDRVARLAFKAARSRRGSVTHVDKQNVLATSRLWRRRTTSLHAADYPDVELSHVLVDAMAMALVLRPRDFDVVLTENMFGDILTDEAAVLAGSIGLLPSASIGERGAGLFEPIHGSAPDIAGRGVANPVGMIRCVAMMLERLGERDAAAAVEAAVADAIAAGVATRDLGGTASTDEMAEAIVKRIGS